MKKITQEEFDESVRKHHKFLDDEPDGASLKLKEVDLTDINFGLGDKYPKALDLSYSIFYKCNFSGVDLSNVNFSFSHLNWSNLSNTTLHLTNFIGADLKYADFTKADMRYSPNFANTTGRQRIYQVSCGLGIHDDNKFFDWNSENATLTMHVDCINNTLELFINDFRGTLDEFIKLLDREYICKDEREYRQYHCALRYLWNIAVSNDINCWDVEESRRRIEKHQASEKLKEK